MTGIRIFEKGKREIKKLKVEDQEMILKEPYLVMRVSVNDALLHYLKKSTTLMNTETLKLFIYIYIYNMIIT